MIVLYTLYPNNSGPYFMLHNQIIIFPSAIRYVGFPAVISVGANNSMVLGIYSSVLRGRGVMILMSTGWIRMRKHKSLCGICNVLLTFNTCTEDFCSLAP